MTFDEVGRKLERILAHPVSLALFLIWCGVMPFLSIDAANYGISFITAFLLFVTLGPSIKERKGVHIKLDDLEDSIEEADSGNVGIENRL